MRSRFLATGLSLCMGLATVLFTPIASAQFDALERMGGVTVGGNFEFQDYGFSRSSQRFDALGLHNSGYDPLGAGLGIDDLTLSVPFVTASASSRAEQLSLYDGVSLHFDGRAHVSMAGEAQAGVLSGNVAATVNFSSTFSVNEPLSAVLTMASDITNYGFYAFALLRHDGVVIWDKPEVNPAAGGTTDSFSTLVAFAPGSYMLTASLRALAGVDLTRTFESSSVDLQFSLSPVPEVGTAALLALGLACLATPLAVAAHRRHPMAGRPAP